MAFKAVDRSVYRSFKALTYKGYRGSHEEGRTVPRDRNGRDVSREQCKQKRSYCPRSEQVSPGSKMRPWDPDKIHRSEKRKNEHEREHSPIQEVHGHDYQNVPTARSLAG